MLKISDDHSPMRIDFVAAVVISHLTSVLGWDCGIGPVSKTIAYIIAFPSDAPGINNCCIEHDTLIDAFHVAREEADRVFCQCLSNKNSWYTQIFVKPLFCTAVILYTKWFDNAPQGLNITAQNPERVHIINSTIAL